MNKQPKVQAEFICSISLAWLNQGWPLDQASGIQSFLYVLPLADSRSSKKKKLQLKKKMFNVEQITTVSFYFHYVCSIIFLGSVKGMDEWIFIQFSFLFSRFSSFSSEMRW